LFVEEVSHAVANKSWGERERERAREREKEKEKEKERQLVTKNAAEPPNAHNYGIAFCRALPVQARLKATDAQTQAKHGATPPPRKVTNFLKIPYAELCRTQKELTSSWLTYDLTVRRENRACLPDLEVRTSVDSDLRYPCTQGTEAFLRDNSSAEHSQPFVKIVKELLVAAAAAAAPRSLPIR
jgi:hypothetical protein